MNILLHYRNNVTNAHKTDYTCRALPCSGYCIVVQLIQEVVVVLYMCQMYIVM